MSQIYPLRVLSAFWLTAGPPAPPKLANTCGKRLSLEAPPVGLAQDVPVPPIVAGLLTLSCEGRTAG